jgi:hypothetical protein
MQVQSLHSVKHVDKGFTEIGAALNCCLTQALISVMPLPWCFTLHRMTLGLIVTSNQLGTIGPCSCGRICTSRLFQVLAN